ncbi:hypothetical protein [Chromobacterium sp. IIBBL 290-4]|uniref:hypothetical protein n=1 Tax=Chromobacterium sp. IIBBL 290-4 TaxID=2953890 RepID=UPI0020B860EF|nr:hypothetical protein [Chromobacterium sp. IIBBL 290-4]UTH74222.1 hypothetical protein NKT35_22225 [Chromobacterium sp. IIBBL 290-4]
MKMAALGIRSSTGISGATPASNSSIVAGRNPSRQLAMDSRVSLENVIQFVETIEVFFILKIKYQQMYQH